MSSRGESLMLEVLARLEGSPALTLGAETVTVRRKHRVPVTREDGPTVDLIGGTLDSERTRGCATKRRKQFMVSIIVRDDDGEGAVDALVTEINERLDPEATPYINANLIAGSITPDEEIADEDAIRIDMRFTFEYTTEGWSLA